MLGLPVFLMLGWWKCVLFLVVLAVISFIPHGNSTVIKNFYIRNFPNYFTSCSLRIEEGADNFGKYEPTVLCCHPHGIFSIGWGICYVLPAFAKLHFCFSPVLSYSSMFRIFSKCLGNPGSASKDSIMSIFKRRESWAIIPGGFEEATIHSPDKARVFLKERAGFVKYALMNGYSLTPVYTFGEEKSFGNLQGAWGFRLWLNSFGIPAIFPWGVWWCPILMRSVPILITVGSPMKLPKIEKPSKAEVKKYHEEYIAFFQAFWDRNNPNKAEKLEIW